MPCMKRKPLDEIKSGSLRLGMQTKSRGDFIRGAANGDSQANLTSINAFSCIRPGNAR